MGSHSFPYVCVPSSEGLSWCVFCFWDWVVIKSKKSIIADHNIEAYRIDEHQGMDTIALRNCIDAINDNKMAITTITLLVLPSSSAEKYGTL